MDSRENNKLQSARFRVSGMSCASCVGRVEKAVSVLPGVRSVVVNLATGEAAVESDVAAEHIIAALRKAGYRARVIDAGEGASEEEKEIELKRLRRDWRVALIFTIPIFLLDMGVHWIGGMESRVVELLGRDGLHRLLFGLAAVVQFGPGMRFYRTGAAAMLRRSPDMNSLVMLGTSAAFGFSVVATFFPQWLPEGRAHVYFEASAMIVALVLTGRVLESRARGKAGSAIRQLIGLSPRTARRVEVDAERDVAIEDVQVGDVLRVRPGERIPVDADVVSGESHVDEAMVTGEPVPKHKQTGAEVIGGTLNGSGTLTVRAKHVGADTLLARIVDAVREAQAAKLPIQSLVDRVTLFFVPVVMLAAAGTFAAWYLAGASLAFAITCAVAVLIIACPCAMGLATPMSILVATGRAAECGILFRNGPALQQLSEVNVVAFDKTGTLTVGRPTLTRLEVFEGRRENEVLRLAAAAERGSEHPIGAAVIHEAERRGIPLPEVEEFSAKHGLGIRAEVEGHAICIGTRRFLESEGVDGALPDEVRQTFADEASAPILVAIDGFLAAAFGVSDPPRPEAAETVRQLTGNGQRVMLLSGDQAANANLVAANIGIREVMAELMPEGKSDAIRELQRAGHRVCFVGDGINDAPALAVADVGLAIGSGTDIAIESASVVLMSHDLSKVPLAIGLSRTTLRNVRQNLFWAFAYNVALIPVAAGVLYPAFGVTLSPVFAATAMAASSLCVVGNALRLRKFRMD